MSGEATKRKWTQTFPITISSRVAEDGDSWTRHTAHSIRARRRFAAVRRAVKEHFNKFPKTRPTQVLVTIGVPE